MNTPRDRDTVLAAWLEDGPLELPRETRQAIAVGIRTVPRRRPGIGWQFGGARLAQPNAGLRRLSVALGGAAVVVMAALALNFYVNHPAVGGPVSSADPRSSLVGTWFSTSDADGGTQTMTVRATGDGAVEVVVTDDIATVCSGGPSTMTGTGRLEGSTVLVIPSPVYTCDDGSEPETQNGPPLEEQLRDWTLVLDPQTDTLSDGVGGLWLREGAVVPSPDPTTSGVMWPQSSLEEVREAQGLADAGDPGYTWQVDPELAAPDAEPLGAEILDRFLREELGWEEFSASFMGYLGGEGGGGIYDWTVKFIRCAPGRTNPLYPNDPERRGCAPTIDDFRYETVNVGVAQPERRGPSGIWVVTRWEMMLPSAEPRSLFEHLYPDDWDRQVEQVAPPSDAEVTALLQAFLGARVDGERAEKYLHLHEAERERFRDAEVPILYATTSGAPYERFEIERVQGPVWPSGMIEFKVRLFAEGGTVVEQSFVVVRQEDGRLGLVYGFQMVDLPTTENGQSVPVPYSFFDGEVTFGAAPPWGLSDDGPTFMTVMHGGGTARHRQSGERVVIVADPMPVETGCEDGPAPTDAEALAQSIRSDPDFEATAPVAVTVGGIDALRMDVVAAPGASVCDEGWHGPLVLSENVVLQQGERMRLYLLNLPGGSARILAIAIAAPEPDFEHVVEAAAPIVDSFQFHAP